MNSNTRYQLFVKVQNDKNIKVLHLERLVETRWAYWYKSLTKVIQRYSEIKEVLTILTLEGDQTARACGLLEEISTFRFILTLHIMNDILKCIHSLSCELQSTQIFLPEAMNLVESTNKELQAFRNEESYSKIYEKSQLFAKENGITDDRKLRNERLKRNLTLNKKFDNYFVNSTVGKNRKTTNTQTVRTELFYGIIDR